MRSLQYIAAFASLLACTLLLTACGGAPKCESERSYTMSQEGKRIEVPEDLDELESYKEMTVPQASPRAPREDNGKCIEAPPVIPSSTTS